MKKEFSIKAILLGILASVISSIILGRVFYLIYGAVFVTPQLENADFLWVLNLLTLGFTTTLLAPKYRALHALTAHVVGNGFFILFLPIFAFMSKFVTPPEGVDYGADRYDTIPEAFHHFLNWQRNPVWSLVILSIGILCAYLLVWYRLKRSTRTSNFHVGSIRLIGHLLLILGLIGYFVPVIFFSFSGIVKNYGVSAVFYFIVLAGLSVFFLFSRYKALVFIGGFILAGLIGVFIENLNIPFGGFVFVSALILLGASYFVRIGRRMLALTNQVKYDPDILMLRSFQDDYLSVSPNWIDKMFNLFALRDKSLISQISRELEKRSYRVVTVSNPNSSLPVWTTGFIHASNNWLAEVDLMARKAQLVLMIMGSSSGLKEELKLLTREGLLHKLIIIVPPEFLPSKWAEFWEFACQNLNSAPIPGFDPDILAITFDETGKYDFRFPKFDYMFDILDIVYETMEKNNESSRE